VFFELVAYCIGMSKHSNSSITKVLKQLKKCAQITGIDKTAKGYMIYADNGEKNLIHNASNCYHPLRRWLKQNTSLKALKF
jgi:effector-binding domain-containing protein